MKKFKDFIEEGISPDPKAKQGKLYTKQEAAEFWDIDEADVILSDRNKKAPVWVNDLTSKTILAKK